MPSKPQRLTISAWLAAISSKSDDSGLGTNRPKHSFRWRAGVPFAWAAALVPNAPRLTPVNRQGGSWLTPPKVTSSSPRCSTTLLCSKKPVTVLMPAVDSFTGIVSASALTSRRQREGAEGVQPRVRHRGDILGLLVDEEGVGVEDRADARRVQPRHDARGNCPQPSGHFSRFSAKSPNRKKPRRRHGCRSG